MCHGSDLETPSEGGEEFEALVDLICAEAAEAAEAAKAAEAAEAAEAVMDSGAAEEAAEEAVMDSGAAKAAEAAEAAEAAQAAEAVMDSGAEAELLSTPPRAGPCSADVTPSRGEARRHATHAPRVPTKLALLVRQALVATRNSPLAKRGLRLG